MSQADPPITPIPVTDQDEQPMAVPGMIQNAMFWSFLTFVFSQGAGVVIFLIIAAQLPPAIFGIVAIASMVASFVSIEGRYAAMDAAMQADRYDQLALSSSFFGFLGLTVIVALGMWLSADYVGTVYKSPLIATFIPLFALMLLPIPWLAVMDAIMMRDLRYREFTIRNILATMIGGAFGIAVAMTDAFVWALLAQRVVGLIVAVVLEFHFTRWVPSLQFNAAHARDFIGRYFALWGLAALAQTITRVTLLLFGVRYDNATVGLARAANRISETLTGPIVSPMMGLWFPLMSKVKGNVASERQVYNSILRTSAFLVLPVFAGLAVVTDDVVELILPERYSGVGPIMRAMAISNLLIPILWYNTIAMAALNMNKASMKYTAILVVANLAMLFAFPQVTAAEVLLIMAIPSAIVAVGGNVILNRRLQQTNWHHYVALLPAFIATVIMTAVTSLVYWALGDWQTVPRMVTCVAIGGVVYMGWLCAFHLEWLKDRIKLLRGRGETDFG